MSHTLSIDLYCAAGAGDLAAVVELDDGSRHDVTLADGLLERVYEARPVTLAIRTTIASASDSAGTRERPADATPIVAAKVFDRVHAIPASGRLAYEVVWACECHGELHVADEDGRFGSAEHIECALLVGQDSRGKQLPAPIDLTYKTPLDLPNALLTFGEIICLAGDFFAHLDDEAAARFPDAWPEVKGAAGWLAGADYAKPTLVGAAEADLQELLGTIHRDGVSGPRLGEVFQMAADVAVHGYPARRYLALASQNYCHFGASDEANNEALALYRGYHALARERAAAAGSDKDRWSMAIVTEAFACHFLTDLFASGHMRTPRRMLGVRFGVLRGALSMSKDMHDEDNARGLWVTTTTPSLTKRVVWRAYGDGRLLTKAAAPHLEQVREAVRRSVWEIHEVHAGRAVAADQLAEGLIPRPLGPRQGPLATDVMPNGESHVGDAEGNHPPLFAVLPGGHIGQRQGSPNGGTYVDLEERGREPVTLF